MRVPITMTIFAVGAAIGTAIVAGPRILDARQVNASADQLTTGAAPGTPVPAPSRAPASGAPLPGTRSPSAADPGDDQSLLPDAAAVNLRHKVSGECLDSNNAGEVYLLPCNGGAFQQWKVKENKDGTRVFRDVATGRCLENRQRGQTTPLFTAVCDGNKFQNWFFITEPGLVSLQNDTTRLCMWNAPRPVNTVRCKAGEDDLWWTVSIT
jgi:hypothetical protein